jgi:hypothetical protein
MKVKLFVEIDADIPGEFQDNKMATDLLDQEIRDLLCVGVQFDKYDQPTVLFESMNIITYTPGLGKL